jgi:hypothetical protein
VLAQAYFWFSFVGNVTMLLVKLLIVILLIGVIVSLFSGLFFLIKDDGSKKRITTALSFRIGLSVLAIVVIIIAGLTGVLPIRSTPF